MRRCIVSKSPVSCSWPGFCRLGREEGSVRLCHETFRLLDDALGKSHLDCWVEANLKQATVGINK